MPRQDRGIRRLTGTAYTVCVYSMAAATEKRTQIYLTAAQHSAAMSLARHRRTSFAGIVREALDRYLAGESAGSGPTWGEIPLSS